jgi:hypothetical protein
MRKIGSWSNLLSILFKKDGQAITVRPNQATTYSADRDIQLPPGDAAHVLISATSSATLTNKTFDADGTGNSISNIENADIKSGAAIDAAKIHDGSVSNTEFGYLDGVTSSIQTQLNGKEPTITTLSIAKGGTNSGTALSNNRVMQSSGGAIVEAAAITASRALASDANGIPTHSATTSTELGYVSGVTSSIQTQLNGKQADVITTQGDLIVGDGAGDASRLAIGTNGYILTSNGTTASWAAPAAALESFKADWVTADTSTKVITHSLGTKDVMVQVYDKTDDQTIYVDTVVRTDTNTVTLTASEAPGASGWRVMILKV